MSEPAPPVLMEQTTICGVLDQLLVSNDGSTAFAWSREPVIDVGSLVVWTWPWWMGIIAGAWLLVAVVVAWRKLPRPREPGQPYCRRCNYRLTGLTGTQCPECGQELDAGHVVIGRRVRRRAIQVWLAGAIAMSFIYVGMLAAGVPRSGGISRWAAWYSPALARFARSWDIGWLNARTLHAWVLVPVDMQTRQPQHQHRRYFSPHTAAPKLSSDGRWVFVGIDGHVPQLQGTTLRTRRTFEPAPPAAAAQAMLSHDQTKLFVMHSGTRMERFDLASGAMEASVGSPKDVRRVWSPPGRSQPVAATRGGQWWACDEPGTWHPGETLPSDLDLGRADFARDGRHVLLTSAQPGLDATRWLEVRRADDGRLVTRIDFERPVPPYTVAETQPWLITWGTHQSTSHAGVDVLSLRTGKALTAIELGDQVTVDRAWQPQGSPRLVVVMGLMPVGSGIKRISIYDLSALMPAPDTPGH